MREEATQSIPGGGNCKHSSPETGGFLVTLWEYKSGVAGTGSGREQLWSKAKSEE